MTQEVLQRTPDPEDRDYIQRGIMDLQLLANQPDILEISYVHTPDVADR